MSKLKSAHIFVSPANLRQRDCIIVGGGHNGLITAAYLAKAGLDVLVAERRHCVGGAAVTEEIVPGFKFSRASYLAGLLRPQIISDLELPKYGFKYLKRNPSSFTPTLSNSKYGGKYLILGSDSKENWNSIAQFSKRDADRYEEYEEFLNKVRDLVQPIIDSAPPNVFEGNLRERMHSFSTILTMGSLAFKYRDILPYFYELMTGPASLILDRWFESDILKTTLATDSVIGAMVSPRSVGSAYVLLHHVMGEAAGQKGVWAYVEGGMGRVSESIASCARNHGAEIMTSCEVKALKLSSCSGEAIGVELEGGQELLGKTIVSGASPYHTFMDLLPPTVDNSSPALRSYRHHLKLADYTCGAFKINCAVNRLPQFDCYPHTDVNVAGPMHRGTVHFESSMEDIDKAYKEASEGIPATKPMIEMTIPSSLDSTLAPTGQHVVQLFIQYAPYDVDPSHGSWDDPEFKNKFVERCFGVVEQFCPGFRNSIIGYDALSPLDLERIFNLPRGNIHHSALGLHQLGYARPVPGFSSHRTPIRNLYLASCGNHPGGGVMGAAGRNCANVIKSDLGIFR